MRFDAAQLAIWEGLGKSPAGQQLKQQLQAMVDEVDKDLRSLSGEPLLRAQGRAVLLDEQLGLLSGKPAGARRDVTKAPQAYRPDLR